MLAILNKKQYEPDIEGLMLEEEISEEDEGHGPRRVYRLEGETYRGGEPEEASEGPPGDECDSVGCK